VLKSQPFDYTEWRKTNLFADMSLEEISDRADAYWARAIMTFGIAITNQTATELGADAETVRLAGVNLAKAKCAATDGAFALTNPIWCFCLGSGTIVDQTGKRDCPTSVRAIVNGIGKRYTLPHR